MLQLKDFMPVNFLKKEKYTGSCKGMRFRMEKFEKEGADAPILRVSVCCGLVKNQDRRVFQNGPGNGYTLFLAA